MSINNNQKLKEFNFGSHTTAGLLVCAGGFEGRSLAFATRLRKSRCSIEDSLLLQYGSQKEDNELNYMRLKHKLEKIVNKEPDDVTVNADTPIQSFKRIEAKIKALASRMLNRTALIDISGMTHIWALGIINACLSCGLRTSVVYTEAKRYFPSKREEQKVVRAWRNRKYDIAVKYLQSAGLKAIHILPEFGGNFRPGRQTCLIIFVGYEPNRIEGLVDDYAPGALILLYGKSPHEELWWRTQLSKDLHKELFSKWYFRETEISTLIVDEILAKLEEEFQVLKEQYDVAIAPQCSKMQAVASYLFWRKHPEVQLLFTSPVKFNPKRYSRGTCQTFIYEIE